MLPDSTCRCGKHKTPRHEFCRDCMRRWERAGYPDSGPPEPMDPRDAGLRGAARRLGRPELDPEPADDGPDEYDQRWEAAEPQRRLRAAAPVAAALARCVAARDAEGVRRLMRRYGDLHWSLLVALAYSADPVLAAMVARTAPEPVVRRAARSACELIPAVLAGNHARAAIVIRFRAATWEGYAALAIVLAESFTARAAEACDAA